MINIFENDRANQEKSMTEHSLATDEVQLSMLTTVQAAKSNGPWNTSFS